jgi:phosphoribosylanthranilate isomerase
MWIKICGIRDVETAQTVAQAGADAIGLNFYAQSSRVIAPELAAEIVAALDGAAEPVGVFVNHSAAEIRAICRQCGLRTIQLHGDERADQLADLSRDYRVIRAFRVGAEGLLSASRYLDDCRRLNARPLACLVDANVPGQFGGTGQTAPWETLAREYKSTEWPPLILAGGLRHDNVLQAIATVGPWGVDVAGGVESSVACKDTALVRQFMLNARGSKDRVDSR